MTFTIYIVIASIIGIIFGIIIKNKPIIILSVVVLTMPIVIRVYLYNYTYCMDRRE